jgi:hypothetical protein
VEPAAEPFSRDSQGSASFSREPQGSASFSREPQGSAESSVSSRARALMAEGAMLAACGPRFFEDAMRAYLSAARLAEGQAEPLLEAGRLCRRLRRWGQARRLFMAALARDGRLWQAWAEGAECFDRFSCLRRALWLGRAVGLAFQTGQAIPADVQERFLDNYGRLRSWERWLVRVRMPQGGERVGNDMWNSLTDVTEDRLTLAAVVADAAALGRKAVSPRDWLAAWLVDGQTQPVPPGQRLLPPSGAALLLVRPGPWSLEFIDLGVTTKDRAEAVVFASVEVSPRAEPVELAALARMIAESGFHDRLTANDLTERWAEIVSQAIHAMAAETALDELVEHPDAGKLRAALETALAGPLFRAGLELGPETRLRIESEDYERRRQADREAAKAEELANLQARIDQVRHQTRSAELDRLSGVLDRLAELGGRLRDGGDAARARQVGQLLARLAPADQQALVVGSLELTEPESPSPVCVVSPDRGPVPLPACDAAAQSVGPLRWLGLDRPRLLLGGRDGVAVMAISSEGDGEAPTATLQAVFTVPAAPDGARRRGGVNAAAVAGGQLLATHSEIGLIAWPIDEPNAPPRLLVPAPFGGGSVQPTMTGLSMSVSAPAHSVRAATADPVGGLVFAVDGDVLRIVPHMQEQPTVVLSAGSPVTALAVDGDELYVGDQAGRLTRLDDGRAEVIASFGGPIASLQLIVHGWLRRLLVSAGPAGLALVQPDTRLTTTLSAGGAGVRQAVYSRGWVIAISGRRDRIIWRRRLSASGSLAPDAELSMFSTLGHSVQAIAEI